jgi:hypothetical protein
LTEYLAIPAYRDTFSRHRKLDLVEELTQTDTSLDTNAIALVEVEREAEQGQLIEVQKGHSRSTLFSRCQTPEETRR